MVLIKVVDYNISHKTEAAVLCKWSREDKSYTRSYIFSESIKRAYSISCSLAKRIFSFSFDLLMNLSRKNLYDKKLVLFS